MKHTPTPITVRFGNILEAQTEVLAHGCNTLGVQGAGVALAIRKQHPWAYDAYRATVVSVKPATALEGFAVLHASPLWAKVPERHRRSDGPPIIASMFTQEGWAVRECLVRRAFHDLGRQMVLQGLCDLAFPAIGCGIAKTDDFDIEKLLRIVGDVLAGFPSIRPTLYLL